ncbi:MAG: hypothetical protein NTX59_02345 [Elusimicrobia bacterium]|nr:hypothetical protein [Elusimicrobiota bacterium]
MKNIDKNSKGMKQRIDSPKAADDKSLKKQWQTPEIIEEDVRKTEVSINGGKGADLGSYS